ncbi:LacI family transcriptional regulator [Faecalibacterium sp. An77]|nr:LacI family transcriptional regulator [Faecalibacterium sp. An77]OUP27416.1 LacI family transcriptional regulator [Faecalibacterium sp. An192]
MKENAIMKMISRRDFLKASAVVGTTAALTACGGGDSSSAASTASSAASTATSAASAAAGSANIGVCIYQFADNFMTLYRADLEEYLTELGYGVTIMDGKNDQNTQTEQINTFLQQGVDVLIINPVQTTSAQTIVDTISPSGIPIVFINREPDKAVLDSYPDKCCYVGADARQSGTYQGELILATDTEGDINGDGVITYIMCKGDPENIDAQYRTEYSIKALEDAGKTVNCLYEYLDNWDQTLAQQDVANALAQFGDQIEVVFCNNDAMALGALQSIEQAGRTVGTDIYLVGVDALAEAVQAVVDGRMTGTVLNDDVGQATAATEATKMYVEGEAVEQYYWVDYVKVTPENAADYL